VTDFETLVIKELGDIRAIGTATAQRVESLENRLFDGNSSVVSTLQADIQEIKDDRKSDARWSRIHNVAHYSLTPIVVALHAIARHFGIEI
jgi:hypothetical protein